uniref:CHH (PO-type) variant 2 n=1 Tax=Carcinus maenas TaxID=6759 RepID=Q9GT09_CARMA|nr:CHH (PO-type) variant 2 precursor [Carcinus maenas]
MYSKTIPAMLAIITVAYLCALPHAHARSTQGYGRMDRILAALKTSPMEPSAALAVEHGTTHPLEKKQIYDTSCKGAYDRALFNDLEHVCDDCYNLYRTSYVASACRNNCFENEVFDVCVYELYFPDHEEYLRSRDGLKG